MLNKQMNMVGVIRRIGTISKKRVALLRKILGNDNENELAVEGHRAVIDVLKWKLVPNMILLSKRAVDAPLGVELTKLLAPYSDAVIEVDESTFKNIVHIDSCQGVIVTFLKSQLKNYIDCSKSDATHEAIAWPGRDSLSDRLMVLCDGITDPGNLGTVFRNSHAFGACAVLLHRCCHSLSCKVIRSSLSTVLAPNMLHLPLRIPPSPGTHPAPPASLALNQNHRSVLHELIYSIQQQQRGKMRRLCVLMSVIPSSGTAGGILGSRENPCPYISIPGAMGLRRSGSDTACDYMLVLGSESCGISGEVMGCWDRLAREYPDTVSVSYVTIPMASPLHPAHRADSINVACASAILLSEAHRWIQSCPVQSCPQQR